MRRVLMTIFWAILVTGVTSLFIFANQRHDSVICPEFLVDLDLSGSQQLISKQYIKRLITDAGYKIKGQKLSEINAEAIHAKLKQDPYIKKANLIIGVDGKVKAYVQQRTPLLRAFSAEGRQFYLDTEGYIMPVNQEYPARVLVVSGKIPAPGKGATGNEENENRLSPALMNAFVAAKAVKADAFADALTDQIFINRSGEIELVPKLGNQTILLGDTTLLSEKLNNLKLFYKQGIRNDAWNKYGVIDLRFRDQIVCTKL